MTHRPADRLEFDRITELEKWLQRYKEHTEECHKRIAELERQLAAARDDEVAQKQIADLWKKRAEAAEAT